MKQEVIAAMESNRIILRPWRDSDAEVLFKWASDPELGLVQDGHHIRV